MVDIEFDTIFKRIVLKTITLKIDVHYSDDLIWFVFGWKVFVKNYSIKYLDSVFFTIFKRIMPKIVTLKIDIHYFDDLIWFVLGWKIFVEKYSIKYPNSVPFEKK
jgi:hypothetical protein